MDVTCDLVPAPDLYAATRIALEQDIAGANALLEKAGWKKDRRYKSQRWREIVKSISTLPMLLDKTSSLIKSGGSK